jgi:hypothetical protein
VFLVSRKDLSIAAPVIADSFEMENSMENGLKEKEAARPVRRAFFGQLLATLGGGFLAGSVLHGLLGTKKRAPNQERRVNVTTNPLAVPRTKEGSKSNV